MESGNEFAQVRPTERKASPLLYLITALVISNIALTLWLVVKVSGPVSPVGAAQQGEPLPAYITKEVRQRIYDDFRAAYNSHDSEKFWHLFSDLAQAQMKREGLVASYEQLLLAFGEVGNGTYSHYEYYGKQGNLKAFYLYYVVEFSAESKTGSKGQLKIMISDDGREYGIMGAFLQSTAQ